MKKVLAVALAVVMATAMLAGCAGTANEGDAGTYTILEENFGSEQYGIAVRNDEVALGAAIQAALDEMNEDGTAAEISTKWFGEDAVLKDVDYAEGELVPADDDNSLKTVQDKGALVIGLDTSFPPMGFLDESGEIAGFDIDLANAVAERIGVEAEFQPIDWDAKVLELESGKVDVLWNGLTITDERIEKMLFGKPYLANRQIVIVANDSGITDKAGLEGKKVGVQRDSSAVDAINSEPEVKDTFAELVEFDNNLNAFNDLKVGRIDAVVMDEVVGKYIIATDAENAEK